MGKPFNIITSGDGTKTLFCSEYNETMHSDSGAYLEAVHMHLKPSGLLEKNNSHVRVLDIGFGLGYNILALIYEILKTNPHACIDITSLEKDATYKSSLFSLHFNDDREEVYDAVKQAFEKGVSSFKNCTVSVIFGDARKTVQTLTSNSYDAVFHDPFSPSKNPELWTIEFFCRVKKLMKRNSILTTYSSAPHIRQAFLDAGFITGTGPSVGRKKEGTRAAHGNCINPFSPEYTRDLKYNIKATPYRDPDLKDTRNVILERRIMEMKEKRARAYHQAHQR